MQDWFGSDNGCDTVVTASVDDAREYQDSLRRMDDAGRKVEWSGYSSCAHSHARDFHHPCCSACAGE